MDQGCLAVDIGASSGRLMHGYIKNDKLKLDEIHRFDNKMIQKNGHFVGILIRFLMK